MAENGGNSGIKAPGRNPGASTAAGQAEGPGRQERLARASRDNLKKRKAQQRGRRDTLRSDGAPPEATASGAATEGTVSPPESRSGAVEEGEPDGR